MAALKRLDGISAGQRLAECFVWQDQHARTISLLRATGRSCDTALATQYSHLSGRPWQVYGAQSTRVPFFTPDPVPSVEASLNGGQPKRIADRQRLTISARRSRSDCRSARRGPQPPAKAGGPCPCRRFARSPARDVLADWNPRRPARGQASGAAAATVAHGTDFRSAYGVRSWPQLSPAQLHQGE